MKFTINRNLFIENLNNVMRAISSRATIPILSGIKLDLTDDELTLTGSDTDISIEIKIPVNEDLNVESTGSIVLPARFFSEIVKKLPGKDFSFEVKKVSKLKSYLKIVNLQLTVWMLIIILVYQKFQMLHHLQFLVRLSEKLSMKHNLLLQMTKQEQS